MKPHCPTNHELEKCKFYVCVVAKTSKLPKGFNSLAIFDSYDRSLVHVCYYPVKPSKDDLKSLNDELLSDKEFGLVGYDDELNFFINEN